ncbi:MAG: hypothetical protein V3S60_07635 [Acidimicrobiia bacterium]
MSGEEGSALVIGALSVFLLAIMAAFALDLGALRNERAAGQLSVDAAAASAVVYVAEGNGIKACETALAYMALNTARASAFAGADCSSFPTTCDDTTLPAITSGTEGEMTVTIAYPVPDSSVYMDAGAIGAGAQAVVAADGDQCQRIAVAANVERGTFFARIVGVGQQTTAVHAVARATGGNDDEGTVALLLLERTECDVLSAAGNGGVTVGSVVDVDTGETLPGRIALDTSATVSCGAALKTSGGNAAIIADGPPGCATELAGDPGKGCGRLQVYGATGLGCFPPVCSNGGSIAPLPTVLRQRITRAPVDHRYNCKSIYPASYDIDGCQEDDPASVDQLELNIGASGTPVGWQQYTAAGYPCDVQSDTVLPPGSWHVDCADLRVKADLVFRGGVVFDGDVSISADGRLAVNTVPPGLTPNSEAAVAFFRDGVVSKTGQGSLIFEHALVYLSSGVEFKMAGGSGSFIWTAPVAGPFEDLALWSESTKRVKLAGQANTVMDGVFFAPLAEIRFSGNGAQQQVAAQLISLKLSADGNGALTLKPKQDRSVDLIVTTVSELIR